MKILMFGEDFISLRREAVAIANGEPIAFGFRKPSEFNPENLEPCDRVIAPDHPEIVAAYALPEETPATAKPAKNRK